MIKTHIAYEFKVRHPDGSQLDAEELHAEGEQLMTALLDQEACSQEITDAGVASDSERGAVTVELIVAAPDDVEALEKFLVVARTAIHAIGGATPGWEKDVSEIGAEYRRQAVQMQLV